MRNRQVPKLALFGAVTLFLGAQIIPGYVYAQDRFAGKRLQIVIPSQTLNTGYGLYGSLAANHLGRFLPGKPEVVVSFMPGATGLTLLNYLYTAAPKDGTVIGVIPQDIGVFQATKVQGARFEAEQFEYIMRMAPNVPVHMVRGDAPVQSVNDLKKHEIVTAAVGSVGTHNDLPRALNALVGTRWKVISGYAGGAAARLAMERGEVQASISPASLFSAQLKGWLDTGKVRVIAQYSSFRHPNFPDVPAVVELAQNEADKKVLEFLTSIATIGRGFFAPPKTDSDALRLLRTAFERMIEDEAYLAEASKRGAENIPMLGDELKAYIVGITQTPAEIVERAGKVTRAE